MHRYAFIVSTGRSGSNRLLEMLHHHSATVCRNEGLVSQLDDAVDLPMQRQIPDYQGDLQQALESHIEAARYRNDERDHMPVHHKDFYRFGPASFAVERVLWSQRARKQLSHVTRAYQGLGWQKPTWHLDKKRLEDSLLVIKGAEAGWLAVSHEAHKEQLVVHTLRNPKGYLASWYNRYVQHYTSGDLTELIASILGKLPNDVPVKARLGDAPSSPSIEDVLEAEVWHWRLRNEALFAFHTSERYLLSRYEDVDQDPAGETRRILTFLGLPEQREVMEVMTSGKKKLFNAPHKIKLDPEMISAVTEKALEGSPLADVLG